VVSSAAQAGVSVPATDTVLEVSDLGVAFRGVETVRGVSFNISRGETVALVGESGSGKSVTALSVLQLLPYPVASHPTGSIRVGGTEIIGASDDTMRSIRGRKVSMIFQEPMTSLNPLHRIEKQIGEILLVHRGIKLADSRPRILELLRLVGLQNPEEKMRSFPHELSGGQRQRVMIAMALACEPRLIIADEPTTALDVTVQAQILSLLKHLTAELNSSLILITHDLGIVARYADRVAVMYGGRVVETAPARELYGNPHHPYTEGLIASVPSLDSNPGERLSTIPGTPPDLADLPPGCAFAPRCQHARDECRVAVPRLEEIAPGHERACYGYERDHG